MFHLIENNTYTNESTATHAPPMDQQQYSIHPLFSVNTKEGQQQSQHHHPRTARYIISFRSLTKQVNAITCI
jgi:hypothetical protein